MRDSWWLSSSCCAGRRSTVGESGIATLRLRLRAGRAATKFGNLVFDTMGHSGMRLKMKWLATAGAVGLILHAIAPAQDADLPQKAQAILAESCFGCHGPGQQMGKLRLDTDAAKVAIAGNAAGSLLIQRVKGAGGKPRMPLSGAPVSEEKIAVLERWIDAGARLPAPRKHWAFVPPVRPAVPKTTGGSVRNPIDAFVAARLEKEGLH